MKVRLEEGDYGTYLLVPIATNSEIKEMEYKNRKEFQAENEKLIQTDWDFPGVASTFGYVPCSCGKTDGTIDCDHKTASQMISEAQDYLDAHIGKVVEDPGYFN
jgi:hypothetical protein